MSSLQTDRTWADVLVACAADVDTAERLIRQLRSCEVASLGSEANSPTRVQQWSKRAWR